MPKQIRRRRILQVVIQAGRSRRYILLPQPRNVPNSHRLIQRCGHNDVVRRVELGTHYIVIVPGQNTDARSRLPIPNPDRLIIGRTQDPRILMMEHRRADVIQMPQQREDAPPLLVVPHLDLEVVSAGNEKWLLAVECNSPNRSVMFIELFDQRTDAIVPQLDYTTMQTVPRKNKINLSTILINHIKKICLPG